VTFTEYAGADSSLGVQTPEGIEFVLYPAGLLVRACAWGIDTLVQGALLIVLYIAAGILWQALGYWFMIILIFLLNWFYHAAFEIFWNGQSLGKRIMGIQVVKGNGAPVNPGSSFVRNLLRFADTFMWFYHIAFLCMAASPGFRRFGDWAADTLVVYTAKALSPGRFTAPVLRRPGIPWLADIPAIVPGRKLSYEEKQGILMFARRYPILGKERADEIARDWARQLYDAGRLGDAGELPGGVSEYLLGIAHTLVGAP
jgi:uncharacterized RDD family membrane protein YckC